MAASNKKVVYAFQIFVKRLLMYTFYEKSKKKMVINTALLLIQILFRDSLLEKLSKTFWKIDVY